MDKKKQVRKPELQFYRPPSSRANVHKVKDSDSIPDNSTFTICSSLPLSSERNSLNSETVHHDLNKNRSLILKRNVSSSLKEEPIKLNVSVGKKPVLKISNEIPVNLLKSPQNVKIVPKNVGNFTENSMEPVDTNLSNRKLISVEFNKLDNEFQKKNFLKCFNEIFLKLNSSVHKNVDHLEFETLKHRTKLLNMCETLLLCDLKLSRKNNILTRMWHTCFYIFIKSYQNKSSRVTSGDACYKSKLMSIINDGLMFFEYLYEKLSTQYKFSYQTLIDCYKQYDYNHILYTNLQEYKYFVKIIFIYLGDLARYKEESKSNTDFQLSKTYYLKAHILVPKNSHICSQIALISHREKNYFDTIYFNIRCIEFSTIKNLTPKYSLETLSSEELLKKQNLTVLFDLIQKLYNDNRRKYKQNYLNFIKENKLKRQHEYAKQSHINRYYRIEYWLRPNKSISICDMYNFYDLAAINSNQTDPDFLQFYQEKVLPSLSHKELIANFQQSFLHTFGLLNCRTGLDSYFDVSNQMLAEFDWILENFNQINYNHNLSSFTLVQMFVICIFTISNTFTAENYNLNSGQFTFRLMNAHHVFSTIVIKILQNLSVLFDIFYTNHVKLLELIEYNRTNAHSQENVDTQICIENTNNVNIGNFFSSFSKNQANIADLSNMEQFYILLPCIKIWTDWFMTCKPHLPPQDMNDHKTNLNVNVWQALAEFLTKLECVEKFPVCFDQNDDAKLSFKNISSHFESNLLKQYELVQLPEDWFLDGFVFLQHSPKTSKYVQTPFVLEVAFTYIRINSIKMFGKYLCNQEVPYLKFDPTAKKFVSLVDLDDIEGSSGLKIKDLQEEEFLNSLIELQKIDSDSDLKPKSCPIVDYDDYDDYNNDNEALEEMKSLNICSTERRKLLQYRLLRKQNSNHSHMFKMMEHQNDQKRRFIIKPHYVVFDTNCFINDIESIKNFINKAPFIVTIPLIVIHELEYMSTRGNRLETELFDLSNVDEKTARFINLSKAAKEILKFLKMAFNEHRPGVKAVTSKGTLIDKIDFAEEFYNPYAHNNDDLVLFSCTNLVKDDSPGSQNMQNMRQLLVDAGLEISDYDELVFRDVVLITDDKNLRLKSLCYDVPVKKLSHFLKWTKTWNIL